MAKSNPILQHFIHYAFIGTCIIGFFISCVAFLCYRLLLKPLVFALILIAILPIIGKELIKRDLPSKRIEVKHKSI